MFIHTLLYTVECILHKSVVFSIKNHLIYYPTPININYNWNYGFLLSILMFIQIITGLLLSINYISDITLSFISINYIYRELYNGYCIRLLHANVVSFIFILLYVHIFRSLIYYSYYYNLLTWYSGILIYLLLIIISFLGYVLPWGQLSYWGVTVITNILSIIPYLIEWICGNYIISTPTIKRFFIFHFILSFILLLFIFYHIFYLHNKGSNNPIGRNINYFIPFYIFIILKDLISLNILLIYCILKAITNKISGLIILLYFISILFIFTDYKNYIFNYHLNISYNYIYSFILLTWIGSKLPQEKFIISQQLILIQYFSLLLAIRG